MGYIRRRPKPGLGYCLIVLCGFLDPAPRPPSFFGWHLIFCRLGLWKSQTYTFLSMNSKSSSFLFLGVLVWLPVCGLMGQIIAIDDFDSYSPGAFPDGANGGSGWTSAWDVSGSNSSIVDLSVLLPGQGFAPGDLGLSFTGNNNAPVLRDFSSQAGEVFVSYQFTLTNGSVGNNDFASMWFESSNYPSGPNLGLKGNQASNNAANLDFMTRTIGGQEAYGGPNLQTGTSYFLVGHLFKSGGSSEYDRFSLWVDPAFSDSASPLATSSGTSSFGNVATLGWRLVNMDLDDQVVVNNLTIGATWADVVPTAIPEPSSLAMLGGILALLGVFYFRNRSDRS